jgi:hypothetical protein
MKNNNAGLCPLLFARGGDRIVCDTVKNVHNNVPSNIDTSKTGGDGARITVASGDTKVAKPDTPKK